MVNVVLVGWLVGLEVASRCAAFAGIELLGSTAPLASAFQVYASAPDSLILDKCFLISVWYFFFPYQS